MIAHEYEIADLSDLAKEAGRYVAVDVQEDRGRIRYRLDHLLTPTQIIQVLNLASEQVLSAGHWMQEWKGDIITRDTSFQRPYVASEFEAVSQGYVFRRAHAA